MEEFNVNKLFRSEGLPLGRMISESKSMYKDAYPEHLVVFDANVVTVTNGKIWYGDLDVTRDAEALKRLSEQIGEPLFVLREMDARFGKETNPASELIKKAVWNTSEDSPKIKIVI